MYWLLPSTVHTAWLRPLYSPIWNPGRKPLYCVGAGIPE